MASNDSAIRRDLNEIDDIFSSINILPFAKRLYESSKQTITTKQKKSQSRKRKPDRSSSSSSNNNNDNNDRQSSRQVQQRVTQVSSAEKENDDGRSSNSSSTTTTRQNERVEKRNEEEDDMDVDFTGGGGGDVDMIDESDDTSSTPPDDRPPPRRSPRLAPDNDEASSSTSAQTQSGDTASATDATSVVTLNGKTLPHVRTAVHLPPPHNHESYGNHPQLREHKDCPGDSCTRGSCILRRMIPQMKPGGDLDYNYDETRIVVNQFYPQLRELKCSLLLKVLKEVDKLPDPPSDKSKSTKTTNKKSKTIVRREDTYTSSQIRQAQ